MQVKLHVVGFVLAFAGIAFAGTTFVPRYRVHNYVPYRSVNFYIIKAAYFNTNVR